jgi:hypothetical protein
MGSLTKEDSFKLLDAFVEAGGNFIGESSAGHLCSARSSLLSASRGLAAGRQPAVATRVVRPSSGLTRLPASYLPKDTACGYQNEESEVSD